MLMLIAFNVFILCASATDIEDITFVIISQENEYHAQLANSLQNNIINQSLQLELETPKIYVTHEDFQSVESWQIYPLISHLIDCCKNKPWIVFLEDRTKINLKTLLNVLSEYNQEEKLWIGHALKDKEASIIHHFAFLNDPSFFGYPNIASGFAITVALLTSLLEKLRAGFETNHSEFTIDPSHEFALFVWNNGEGPLLTNDNRFCTKLQPDCATYPSTFEPCGTINPESIFFAVKTCQKYHKDRVEVVQKTWGRYAKHLLFFTDTEVDSNSFVKLDVPNVEQGHCAKTLAMLNYVSDKIDNQSNIKWIVVADDDTILSVSRLQQLLSCYNPDEPIALGERYRYNGQKKQNYGGFNYITGGGGMVFSRALLNELLPYCNCPSPNTPDDMYLGICLHNLGINIVHSPYFHQARPVDYAAGYLATSDAVSFHKHWMIDPVQVYKEWFEDSDRILEEKIELSDGDKSDIHNEL